MARSRVVVNQKGWDAFRDALGRGMLNYAHAVEAGAKREAPVRGGYRSFLTTKRTKAGASGEVAVGADNGSVLIGGTLRRSIHSVAYVDGRPVSGGGQADENGNPVPDYAPAGAIVAYCGTNSGYGAYVEIGTVKMAARPFLGPSVEAANGKAASLIRAGMKAAGF